MQTRSCCSSARESRPRQHRIWDINHGVDHKLKRACSAVLNPHARLIIRVYQISADVNARNTRGTQASGRRLHCIEPRPPLQACLSADFNSCDPPLAQTSPQTAARPPQLGTCQTMLLHFYPAKSKILNLTHVLRRRTEKSHLGANISRYQTSKLYVPFYSNIGLDL